MKYLITIKNIIVGLIKLGMVIFIAISCVFGLRYPLWIDDFMDWEF